MSNQERDVILNRVLLEIRSLFESRHGLTVQELRDRVASHGPDYDFCTRTIRRDCLRFEFHGLVEPRSCEDRGDAWRVVPSRTMKRWFIG